VLSLQHFAATRQHHHRQI